MKFVIGLLILVACLQCALWGQSRDGRSISRPNPTYSRAVQIGRDPKEDLAKAEARVAAGGDPESSADLLARAAKAALEAGENDKAKDYALRALTIADGIAAKQAKRGWPTPRGYGTVPEVDFYANFVLGRLAILQGDIRSAERYLLASAQGAGYPQRRIFPPNMSLALELLKRGDNQSREAVQEFIQQLRPPWNFTPNNPDKWLLDLSAGRTPDFGDYLYQ